MSRSIKKEFNGRNNLEAMQKTEISWKNQSNKILPVQRRSSVEGL